MNTSDGRRKTGRITGLLLIASTPITAFISFAFFASLIDEQRLEESLLGTAVMLLPAVTGLAILAWVNFRFPLPNANSVAIVVGVLGLGVETIGIRGILRSAESNDPNIGAALLVLGGLAMIVAAAAIVAFDRRAERRAASLPPPPTASTQPGPD